MTERPRSSYAIATSPVVLERGQKWDDVPHMTVVRWFERPSNWSIVHDRMRTLFQQPHPFGDPHVGEPALFGEDENVPVHLLTGVDSFPYIGLQGLVKRLGARLTDEPFAGEFEPHITDVAGYELTVGDPVQFASVAIVHRNSERTAKTVSFVVPVKNEETA